MAALAEEDRTGAVQSDRQGDAGHHGGQQHQGGQAENHVLQPLVEGAAIVVDRPLNVRQRRGGQPVQGVAGLGLVPGLDDQADLIGQGPQPGVQIAHPRLGLGIDGQDDTVDIGRHPVGQQIVGRAQNRHALDGARAARQPVVENAQHVQITALQRLADQGLGMAGGPDQHDVGRQGPGRAPAPDDIAPAHMQGVEADQHQSGPDQPGRPLGRPALQDPAGQQGDDGPCRYDGGHRSEVQRGLLAADEPIAPQRSHQAQYGDGPQGERGDLRDRGVDQGAGRGGPGAQQAHGGHGQDVDGAEIVGGQARGVPLSGVAPYVRPERPTARGSPGIGRGADGPGGQGLQGRGVTAGRPGPIGIKHLAAGGGVGHGARAGVPRYHAHPLSLSR